MLDYGFFYDVARFLNEHCKGNYTEKEVACNAYEYMKNYEAFVYSEGKYGSEIKIIMKMLKKMNTDDANSYLYKIETSLQKGKGDYMFKVYCRSKAHKQWKPYSQPFIELDNALKCKEKCESRKLCDVHGNLIEYKVVEEK